MVHNWVALELGREAFELFGVAVKESGDFLLELDLEVGFLEVEGEGGGGVVVELGVGGPLEGEGVHEALELGLHEEAVLELVVQV